ncbi:serine/threonine protein kinase [Colletotrichum plurivorum]|uniref:Serine/threonine protein kinase n=1 Tax=Colletotrichum plurivorum TaxID=2175906 RepID=A0A8H6JZF4_9PEZI|nr:serine/threonine protein kinase [Colletotrichum plurivorum]
MSFATAETAEKVLTADNLRLVYRALTTSDDGQDRGFTIDEDGFVKNIEKKKLHTFLAVLLEANCSIHAVWSFTTKLVEGRTIGTAPDNHHYAGPPYSLPADRTYLKKLFDDDLETVNNFYKAQTYFSTVVLRGGENVKIQHPDISRLPWLKEDWIGSGSFGDVYKVVIAEGHFRAKDNPNKKAKVVARKDYIYEVDAKKSFEDERLAMDKIFRGIVKHVNVLKSLGSLEIECNPPKFSLFMPLALEDLETYMNANNDTAHVALDADARRRLIRSAFGLADGLQYLHQGITTPEGDKLVCYHMDLKPGNILLFKDDRVARENPHDDDRIWKVSDFGMSRVKARQTSTERDKELDLRKLFRSNVKPQQNQASATRNRRGKGTYLPSEAAKETKEMDHKSDIWSLGCVISELFTYMEEGSRGLDAYGERRLGRSEMDADVFYERRKFRHDFGINSEVQSQHKRLIKAASRRNPAERNAVEYMLEFLERNVLRTDKSKRCNAVDVADHLRETRNKYQIRGLEKAVSAPRWLNSFKLPRSVKPAVPQNVEQWRLLIDNTTSLKGCESSPDGTVIVYWSDSKICVFFGPAGASDEKTHFESGSDSRSDSISRSEEAGLIPVERGPPDEQGQSWRSVKLTKRYLIAVTKGGDFNCYIFDIEAASNLTRYSVVPLGHPEVHMFAVSPDEKTIVGILANHAGGTRGSLFTANISQPWASAQLEE